MNLQHWTCFTVNESAYLIVANIGRRLPVRSVKHSIPKVEIHHPISATEMGRITGAGQIAFRRWRRCSAIVVDIRYIAAD